MPGDGLVAAPERVGGPGLPCVGQVHQLGIDVAAPLGQARAGGVVERPDHAGHVPQGRRGPPPARPPAGPARPRSRARTSRRRPGGTGPGGGRRGCGLPRPASATSASAGQRGVDGGGVDDRGTGRRRAAAAASGQPFELGPEAVEPVLGRPAAPVPNTSANARCRRAVTSPRVSGLGAEVAARLVGRHPGVEQVAQRGVGQVPGVGGSQQVLAHDGQVGDRSYRSSASWGTTWGKPRSPSSLVISTSGLGSGYTRRNSLRMSRSS